MAKVLIEQVDGRVKFTFTDSSHYQYNGVADWPLNSLSMTLDDSSMVTFKNQAGDIVYSILLSDLEKTKAEMEELYADVFVGDTGGITPEEVAEMIDEAVAPVEDDIETIADDINEKEEVVARALTDLHENKQDKLTAGSGITISGNVISAEGGVVVDPALDSGSTNPVANSAITNGFNAYTLKANSEDGIKRYFYVSSPASPYGSQTIWNFSINGRCPLSQETGGANAAIDKFKLVETSAITTSMTASSTNAQVPSAKAVYDQLGGLKLVKCTQAEYDALVQGGTVDADTLYVITNVV